MTCGENAECLNTEGTYSCQCRSGFTGDGYSCSGRCNSISLMDCNTHSLYQYFQMWMSVLLKSCVQATHSVRILPGATHVNVKQALPWM